MAETWQHQERPNFGPVLLETEAEPAAYRQFTTIGHIVELTRVATTYGCGRTDGRARPFWGYRDIACGRAMPQKRPRRLHKEAQ
jgi:hypothetical protein